MNDMRDALIDRLIDALRPLARRVDVVSADHPDDTCIYATFLAEHAREASAAIDAAEAVRMDQTLDDFNERCHARELADRAADDAYLKS